MLVIDRVELVALDETLQVRNLDCDHAVRLEERLHATDEVVQVWDVRHHVVGRHQVRPAPLGDEP